MEESSKLALATHPCSILVQSGVYLGGTKLARVLGLVSQIDARNLREFLVEIGYTDENLRGRLRFNEIPSYRKGNFAQLLDRTREPNCLNTLLRWFWVG